MWTKDFELIYKEYLSLYKAEGIPLQASGLRAKIVKAANKAKGNYKKLKKPKTCSINTYINLWVKRTIRWDWATKAVKKVSLDNPPPSFKASAEYFSLFPYELHIAHRKKLFGTKPEKRKMIWKSFGLPIKQIEKNFIKMTEERKNFASKKGYSSYLHMFLNSDKIPRSEYKHFIKNADKIIEYCNQQLPEIDNLPAWFYSKFNLPCFICIMPTFPFKTFNETLDYFAKKYKILNKFRHKINIKLGNDAKMLYKKETDCFEIIINQDTNIRHQITELIHELSHIVNFLRDFGRGVDPLEKGVYLREKEALKIELSMIKKASPLFLKAFWGEVLKLLWKLLFELKLYKNPNQDLSKLYAKTFNQCFKKAKQEKNPLYILDDWIVLHPFTTLPHAIAHSQVIYEELINQQSP